MFTFCLQALIFLYSDNYFHLSLLFALRLHNYVKFGHYLSGQFIYLFGIPTRKKTFYELKQDDRTHAQLINYCDAEFYVLICDTSTSNYTS